MILAYHRPSDDNLLFRVTVALRFTKLSQKQHSLVCGVPAYDTEVDLVSWPECFRFAFVAFGMKLDPCGYFPMDKRCMGTGVI